MSNVRRFDGVTFHQRRDGRRLTKQFERVRDLMLDGEWRTLGEIGEALGIPEASASARLRDLRKPEFGGFLVERKYVDAGLYLYRLRAAKVEVIAPALTPETAPPVIEGGEIRLFDPASTTKPLGAYDDIEDAA